MKIAIIIGLLGYLALAAYMMITNFKTIPLKEDNLDAFQNFFFLYIFGLFTLHMEIFSKISDLDGTGNNQYHYSIADEDEYVKINLTRSKKEETHD